MASLSLSAVRDCVGGEQFGADVAVRRVCTDSRQIVQGDLFVALSGEHFDGNRFASDAKAAGAAAALLSKQSGLLPEVVVADTRLALGQLGRNNRRQLTGPLIALTGSSGKTSTKEMVASIMARCGAVYATQGNLNNEIGVPLSLLAIAPEHTAAVIEMGAAKRGDIRYLCDFAEPDIAILTNAQPAHIEGFGSLQAVADTKGEIFSALSPAGTAVINADDSFCSQWCDMASHCTRLLFSLRRDDVDVWAENIVLDDAGRASFELHAPAGSAHIVLPVPGRHMVANALAAAAAASAAGADVDAIAAGLQNLSSVSGRLCRIELAGIVLIDDSYNANPGSVAAAIDVLACHRGGRKLVLGAMAELGPESRQLHLDIAIRAREAGIEALYLVGEHAAAMAQAFGDGARSFADRESLLDTIKEELKAGDAVLVKGSRSAGMDVVCDGLTAHLNGLAAGGGS